MTDADDALPFRPSRTKKEWMDELKQRYSAIQPPTAAREELMPASIEAAGLLSPQLRCSRSGSLADVGRNAPVVSSD
jgi:hypothetical protein